MQIAFKNSSVIQPMTNHGRCLEQEAIAPGTFKKVVTAPEREEVGLPLYCNAIASKMIAFHTPIVHPGALGD